MYYEKAVSKFNYINETYFGIEKRKEYFFKEIYDKSKELIIDIYFYDYNSNNNIIDEIFEIVLSLFGGLSTFSVSIGTLI